MTNECYKFFRRTSAGEPYLRFSLFRIYSVSPRWIRSIWWITILQFRMNDIEWFADAMNKSGGRPARRMNCISNLVVDNNIMCIVYVVSNRKISCNQSSVGWWFGIFKQWGRGWRRKSQLWQQQNIHFTSRRAKQDEGIIKSPPIDFETNQFFFAFFSCVQFQWEPQKKYIDWSKEWVGKSQWRWPLWINGHLTSREICRVSCNQ